MVELRKLPFDASSKARIAIMWMMSGVAAPPSRVEEPIFGWRKFRGGC